MAIALACEEKAVAAAVEGKREKGELGFAGRTLGLVIRRRKGGQGDDVEAAPPRAQPRRVRVCPYGKKNSSWAGLLLSGWVFGW